MSAGGNMRATRILETCLYVDDLDAAERFYSGVLGLTRVEGMPGRHVFFRCGDAVFLLFDADATAPEHGAHGPGHVAFAMRPDEADAWREHLRASGVEVEAEVSRPSGGCSLYFRDPAGNLVELTPPQTWHLPE